MSDRWRQVSLLLWASRSLRAGAGDGGRSGVQNLRLRGLGFGAWGFRV